MSKQLEAMRLALEALDALWQRGVWGDFHGVADNLRAALAERDNYAESASLLAQAVVLAEREKCAQLVETYEKAGNTMNAPEYVMVFKDCAAAIRARGRQ